MQVRGLPHHVRSRQVLAALLEHLHEALGHAVAVDREIVVPVALRIILRHEGEPRLEPGIARPDRIGRILEKAGGQDSDRVLHAGRLQH